MSPKTLPHFFPTLFLLSYIWYASSFFSFIIADYISILREAGGATAAGHDDPDHDAVSHAWESLQKINQFSQIISVLGGILLWYCSYLVKESTRSTTQTLFHTISSVILAAIVWSFADHIYEFDSRSQRFGVERNFSVKFHYIIMYCITGITALIASISVWFALKPVIERYHQTRPAPPVDPNINATQNWGFIDKNGTEIV